MLKGIFFFSINSVYIIYKIFIFAFIQYCQYNATIKFRKGEDDCMNEFNDYNIILIGLGPHAKRIYMNLFKKYRMSPKVIVDLKSKRKEIENYLEENDFRSVDLYLLDDYKRDNLELTNEDKQEIQELILQKKIKYAIISTEPKSHFAYAKFFLENDINILMDKPVTAPVNVNCDTKQALKIKEEYNTLCQIYKKKKDKISFKIQCQRRFHEGYLYVKRLLEQVVREYNIPITYIDIYHNDGMWNMPSEFLERENHPYKYGYGKLFHSGYHFIDLVAWLMEVNRETKGKQINNAEMFVSTYNPIDFFNTFNNYDYKRILKTNRFEKCMENKEKFIDFGEIDFHSIINFKEEDKLITNCSINLMQSGFSRRAWCELPKDTYKGNGRVRHERLNIQVGPLMNIQIHSYQAYEIKDRDQILNNGVGSVEHFDIYVFRNSQLIGGKTFETLDIATLSEKDKKYFNGYNEKARENCFINFLLNIDDSSDLLEHRTSIEITEKAYEAMSRKKSIINFDIKV